MTQVQVDEIALNEVDRVVKHMMLNYPLTMTSRFAVLRQLFLTNGNGMDWKDGRLVDWHESKTGETMDFTDLDEREKENDKSLSDPDCPIRGHYLARRCQLQRERMSRQHIVDNIDVYATEHVMNEGMKYNAEWLRHIDPKWTALSIANPFSNHFPDKMHPDWADAAEEITRIARDSLWRDLGMYHERFDRAKADPDKLKKYDEFCAILDRLDAFTGWKEREKRANEVSLAIVAELKKGN